MEKNVGLSFDATISAKDAKNNLKVPVIRKKSNTKPKIKATNPEVDSVLNSEIAVKDLVIDMSYQRFPNETKVNNIVKNFNKDALGVFICSIREDGTIAVIDGGHRVAALRMMNLENSNVNCLVYFGLSISQEAEIFTLLNDSRTKPKTQDIFKSKVVSGDSDSIKINEILVKHGLEISNGPSNNAIRAIGTISTIYKSSGADVLNRTILVLSNAFDKHSTSFSDSALIAISKIIVTFKKNLDYNRLINVLNTFGSANLWKNKGSVVSKTMGYKDVNVGMIVCLLNEYNKRLKANRLEIKDIV